jgi:hypothetical protein
MNPGNLEKFLKETESDSVPAVVDMKIPSKLGLTGNNDKIEDSLLGNFNIIDKAGKPQQYWCYQRHAGEAARVRGGATKAAYRGYFDLYADAQQRSESRFPRLPSNQFT